MIGKNEDKLMSIKIKNPDGIYTNEVPVGVLVENVKYDEEKSLKDILGEYNCNNGTIEERLSSGGSSSTGNNVIELSVDAGKFDGVTAPGLGLVELVTSTYFAYAPNGVLMLHVDSVANDDDDEAGQNLLVRLHARNSGGSFESIRLYYNGTTGEITNDSGK